jgi:hypothetical protein
MSTFDAPDRETCQVRRARTNTPLQALVLMNDVQYIEAARKLAERIMLEGGVNEAEKLVFAFRTILARSPTASELATLNGLHAEYLSDFKKESSAAEKLLSAGDSKRNEKLDLNEVAAWTMIAHLILNLSETVTKG